MTATAATTPTTPATPAAATPASPATAPTTQPAAGGDGGKGDGETTSGAGGESLLTGETPSEEFKLTIPDGFNANEDNLSAFTELAKKLELDADKASELVKFSHEINEAAKKAQQEAVAAEVEGWKKAIREDKEFGGAVFQQTLVEAKRALKAFGGDLIEGTEFNELGQAIEELGIGSHPAVIKMLARVGRGIKEDSTVAGGGAKGAADPDAALREMYPSHFNPDGTRKTS